MRPKHCALLLAFLLLTLSYAAGPAAAQEPGTSFTGKVVVVKDGDTVDVLRYSRAVTVRLHGVDAPEMNLPFGRNYRSRERRVRAAFISRSALA